jgi:L-alanine-DL-glutamate epimerase-like enolase superfamily enzyme
VKIRSIEAVPLEHKYTAPPKWYSDYGPKTESHAIIVKVDTDEGLIGYGEVHPGYGYTAGACWTAKTIVEKELAPEIIGEDPTRPEYVWEKLFTTPRTELAMTYGFSPPRLGRRGVTICAMSGIDMALWDIFGKSLGVPTYKLLGGGYRTKIAAYASGGHAPAEHAGEQALSYLAHGFRAMKMRVGGMDAPRITEGSTARIAAVRDAIGPDIGLMIDAHGSLTTTQAINLALAAEEYDIAWFEEPVSSDNWSGMARVRNSTSIPISTGENDFTRYDFREIIANESADILQPDLALCGGFTSARRISTLAQTANLQVAPHVWGSAVLFYASLHLAAAMPNCPIFEFRTGEFGPFTDLVDIPPSVDSDGFVHVPDRPGLGFELDLDEAARKYPFE